MFWLYIAVLAYFLNAVSFIVDKHLLSSAIPRPFAYAFWVAVLSGSAVVLIPFGVTAPPFIKLAAALVSGAAFFFALLFFYRSVKGGDVAVSSAKTGAFTIIFSYFLSLIFLPDSLVTLEIPSLLLFIVGILFLGRAGRSIFRYTLAAGLGFALSLVFLKLTFNGTDYINGVFWSRLGFVAVALLSLVSAHARKQISVSFRQAPVKSKYLFVANKILVGAAFLILYYAILRGDVTLVNALMGTQFAFIFLLSLILQKRIPALREYASKENLRDRLLGVACIVAGFLIILL